MAKKKTKLKKTKKRATAAKKKSKAKKAIKKVAKKSIAKKKSLAKKKSTKKADIKKTKKKSKSKSSTSKKTKKVEQQIPLNMDAWPRDRELVWNPSRHKYLTGPRTQSCVFCAAANYGVGFESLCLLQSDGAQVILNKFPYHTGHIMVMPQRHIAELEDLQEQEFIQIMNLIRSSTVILKKAYNCEGINIGINLGKAAGAGIPGHLHWHLIPRWTGDTNFFPAIAGTRVISEGLEDTYKKLFPMFREESKKAGLPGSRGGSQVEFKLED